MTTQISSDNIQAATLATLGSGPTVTNVQITDSSYNVLDDTAVGTSGGYIKITGTNFASGCSVIINSTNATSVTFVSSTVLNVQVPAMAAGTYIVYVVNSDGGIAIRVNGLTYSGTPSWVTGSTLPQSVVGTAISIQLSATSDSTITYALQAGSSLPTGLTLSSSGLLSGTITNLSAETTYNFTITATDVELQDSPRSFSITITVSDTYWNYVSTLLSASSPTTLPFNDDASTNNFAVTVNGDTRPYNFNPYTPGYYSNYFDGSTGKLTLPSSASMSLTGEFTIECWVYWAGTSPLYQNFIGSNNTFTSNASYFRVWGSGIATLGTKVGIGNPTHDGVSGVYSTTSLLPNIWYHVAATRDSSNIIRVFVNGVLERTGSTDTSTYDFGQGGTCIGDSPWDGAQGWYQGYISNLRVIKGTCLYTASFTPSTSPLTAVTNTSLLTCQSNRFIDNSTNSAVITVTGTVTTKSLNPYIPNPTYSTYGSTYFDGNGDYLTVASNAAFGFGTGDFTIECWIYPTNAGAALQQIYDNRTATADTKVNFGVRTNTITYCVGSSTLLTSAASSIVNNAWQHVAIVKSSGTTKIYINGTQSGSSYADSYNFTSPAECVIATPGDSRGSSQYSFTGYISDIRVTKGQAVYSANFTPPTTLLTSTANTSLLTCQTDQPINNNIFIDNSTNNLAITRVGNTTQGTLSPYGENWSNYFDGTGDNLQVSSTATPLDLGSDNFTVEFWLNASSWSSGTGALLGKKLSDTTSGWYIYRDSGQPTKLAAKVGPSASYANFYSTSSVNVGVWEHWALVRNGTTLSWYKNGVLDATTTNSANISDATASFNIGYADIWSTYNSIFYLSNLRVVKGTAVYTTTFTPSITPLQPVTGTSLLTCQSMNISDKSANNFTVTKIGDVSVQKFGPFAGTTLPTPYYGAYFDGAGDYLTIPSNAAFQLGTGDYTFEAWIYPTVLGSNNTNNIINIGDYTTGLLLRTAATTGVQIYTNGVSRLTTSTGLTANAWQHIALVRSGSACTFYVNGSSIGTFTDSSSISPATATVTVGMAAHNSSEFFTGYMSSYRLVKGTAVYTSTFTPSTSPLTAISGTSLLICQSNTFVDNSANNFTITAYGNSKPTPVT